MGEPSGSPFLIFATILQRRRESPAFDKTLLCLRLLGRQRAATSDASQISVHERRVKTKREQG